MASAKLNAVKFGLAGGIITAICIFITTMLTVLKPTYAVQYAGIIKDIYGFLGYDTTLLGALLGAVYGFVDGFILTWIFAAIYNKLL